MSGKTRFVRVRDVEEPAEDPFVEVKDDVEAVGEDFEEVRDGVEPVASLKDYMCSYEAYLARLPPQYLKAELVALLRSDEALKARVKQAERTMILLPAWARKIARERLREAERERRRVRRQIKAAIMNYAQRCDKNCMKCPFEKLCLQVVYRPSKPRKIRWR